MKLSNKNKNNDPILEHWIAFDLHMKFLYFKILQNNLFVRVDPFSIRACEPCFSIRACRSHFSIRACGPRFSIRACRPRFPIRACEFLSHVYVFIISIQNYSFTNILLPSSKSLCLLMRCKIESRICHLTFFDKKGKSIPFSGENI